jgi:DNA-directed RNA polymerase subunit alpha
MSAGPDPSAPIDVLGLSARARNCLRRAGLTTVASVLATSGDDLLSLRNFGSRSFFELRDKLVEHGYAERGDRER